jgi:hypothetical protein
MLPQFMISLVSDSLGSNSFFGCLLPHDIDGSWQASISNVSGPVRQVDLI